MCHTPRTASCRTRSVPRDLATARIDPLHPLRRHICEYVSRLRRTAVAVIEAKHNPSSPWMITLNFRAVASMVIAADHFSPEGNATIVTGIRHDLPTTVVLLKSLDGSLLCNPRGTMAMYDKELVYHKVCVYPCGQP